MLLSIAHILSPDDLTILRNKAAEIGFVDGKKTAGAMARAVKTNTQAPPEQASALLDFAQKAIARHPVFAAAARPANFSGLILSSYENGDHYGRHVDNAFMGSVRTDLAFTLFLNDPDTYEGGELVIELAGGDQTIKLPAGSMVLYSATTIHQVMPVTKGQRLCVVGWVQSKIADELARETLFDLANIRASLGGDHFAALGLSKIESNLLRLFAR